MAKRLRQSQEQEIADMLKTEGFKELTEEEIGKEPYKSIYALPDCLKEDKLTGQGEVKD